VDVEPRKARPDTKTRSKPRTQEEPVCGVFIFYKKIEKIIPGVYFPKKSIPVNYCYSAIIPEKSIFNEYNFSVGFKHHFHYIVDSIGNRFQIVT
jgi:hypothetical protein